MAQAIPSILQKTLPIPARELMRLFAERHRATQTLAHREAVKAVKQQLRARGIKLHTLKHREIISAADNYLAEHQAELIPAAQATVERWTLEGVFGKRVQRAAQAVHKTTEV